MRAVFALVLVVGMALAGVAVYMAQSYLGQTQAELARATALKEKTGKLVQVYAVNKSMTYGAKAQAFCVSRNNSWSQPVKGFVWRASLTGMCRS